MPVPRGRKDRPTTLSITELLPELWKKGKCMYYWELKRRLIKDDDLIRWLPSVCSEETLGKPQINYSYLAMGAIL